MPLTSPRVEAADLPLLRASLSRSPVVRVRDYDYFVHPLSDGIPEVAPAILAEVLDELARRLPPRFEKILTAEALGIPLATGLALRTGRPFSVARKRSYALPGEIKVTARKGYSESVLHVHGLRRGERVVIVDDVLSTGGTLRALVQACRQAGVVVEKCIVIFDKHHDVKGLTSDLDCPVEALLRIRVEAGRVHAEA